ncbi:MAG: cell division protein SepF [Candidatus Heimdallarchaeaceae archaeon]
MGIRRKVSRNSTDEVEEIPVNQSTPGVKFYSLIDIVKAELIMDEVKEGNLIFLNLSRISAYPERKSEFLQSLKDTSAQLHATLKMVSEETLMVAPQSVPIEIRSLSPSMMKKKKVEK